MSERVLAQRAEATVRQGAGLPSPAGFAGHVEQYVLDEVGHLGPGKVGRRDPLGTGPVFLSTGSNEVQQFGHVRVATLKRALSHGQQYRLPTPHLSRCARIAGGYSSRT